MVWMESAAAVFGFLCVWLTVRQSLWCWPCGLVQVTIYLFVFYRARLYSDVILHAVYVVLQVYGWIHWRSGRGKSRELPVSSQAHWLSAAWAAAALLGTLLWGYLMATRTDAALPYWDAFIIAASLIAQWLMARKVLESWFFWMAVDVVAIGVYSVKELYLTTVLYALFLALCVSGFRAWRRSRIASPAPAESL